MIRRVRAALVVALLAGCVITRPRNDTGPIRERADVVEGMIVGHLRFPGHEVQGVLLYEDGTSYFGMEPRAPRAHVYPNGDFVFENLKPVPYRILCFYSGGRTYAVMTHETKNDPRHRYEVRPGEITYVGSYTVDENLAISRLDHPRLAEILVRLLPLTTGTYWQRAIQERLTEGR